MSVFEQINRAHNYETFKDAAQAVRDLITSGQDPNGAQVALFSLSIRGHALLTGARGRDLKAAHLISNQVMLTLQAEPRQTV